MQARLLAGLKRLVCACDKFRNHHLYIIRSFRNNFLLTVKGICSVIDPGFWKINNSVLNDDKFLQDLSSKIPKFKRKYNYLEDRGLYWDMLKWRLEVSVFNICTETLSWSHIPLYYLQDVGGFYLLQCNFDLKLLKTNIPIDFYKEALNAWKKINCRTPHTIEQVFNEIVWNNRYIKVEGFSFYYKKWHEAGVTKIEDIFQDSAFLPFNNKN